MVDPEKIISMALVALPSDRVPTEDEIRDTVTRLAAAFSADSATIALVMRNVMARRLVRMDTGFALAEQHTPWLNARRPEIDPFYWSRFQSLLQQQNFPGPVINGMDRSTDEILDLLGNPAERDTWKRRGLVMGDVQSGKTATYSALICKAADAGYRFIVLLTGTLESLRRQTQERLDMGFVGFDSSEQLKRNRRDKKVGVGLLDGRRQATVFTSSSADFRVSTVNSLGLSLDALREPALVVVKKHTRILENLHDWLSSYNTSQGDGIDIPILVIDDEADNASINTNDADQDPTAVNARIRELLKLFRRTTYVGFTATPFANIFVTPDSKEEMLGDDLFPRDFIYALQAPTNYFSPRRVFISEEGHSLHLRALEDAENVLPARHKVDAKVLDLPPSLKTGLCAFLISNAIRDLRQEGPTHRSMLVNVSQFTKVQDQVEELLRIELGRLQTDIRLHSGLASKSALKRPTIKALYAVWEKEYPNCEFDWETVQRALLAAALPITTVAVNQRTGTRALDYRAHKDTGLRVVAVGGNSLSRGLTLEGLVISYFRRKTKMYDTLLQMGRWFGYRPGYEDLCRVWLPQEAMDWYGHISEATDELRGELRRMFRAKRTPKEFGLEVRAHPDSLLVTARNKMRLAGELTRIISVSGHSFESVELPPSKATLEANWDEVQKFVSILERHGLGEMEGSARVFQGVSGKDVSTLLRRFGVPSTDMRFQPAAIADLLDDSDGLNQWDVSIPQGAGAPIKLGSLQMKMQQRKLQTDTNAFVVSGQNRRVGSRGVEKTGLTEAQRKEAEENARQAAETTAKAEGRAPPKRVNVADKFYREVRSRPLLIIHVIEPAPVATLATLKEGAAYVAIGLSLPRIDGTPARREVKYKINLVKVRELFAGELDPGDEQEAEADV